MAQIDVTELLSDPDFVDEMQLITRVPTVNNFGEMTLTDSVLNSYGVIQTASGKAIQRLPEAMRVDNYMSFWFKGEITTSSPGKYTSILVFRGKRFQVMNVFDWMNWGEGWCEGLCLAEEVA